MELILIAVLVVVVIAFIAYPLVKGEGGKMTARPNALDSLIAQRDSAYDAIRDLDFDYQMGKLSQADYEQLRDRYKARAAQALQQIDAVAGTEGAGDRIEDEVARLRRRRAATTSGEATGDGATAPTAEADDVVAAQEARLREWRASRRATRGGEEAKSAPAQASESVEDEVARLRTGRGKDTEVAASVPYGKGSAKEVAAARGEFMCANCGTPYHAGDRFCAKCGAKL